MWVASTHSRAGLIKLEEQGWVFYGFCMIRKALGLMEIGPREATQGESQGESGSRFFGTRCSSE